MEVTNEGNIKGVATSTPLIETASPDFDKCVQGNTKEEDSKNFNSKEEWQLS